jgi:hypothetical protein
VFGGVWYILRDEREGENKRRKEGKGKRWGGEREDEVNASKVWDDGDGNDDDNPRPDFQHPD